MSIKCYTCAIVIDELVINSEIRDPTGLYCPDCGHKDLYNEAFYTTDDDNTTL